MRSPIVPCPVCTSEDVKPSRIPQLLECSRCGFIYYELRDEHELWQLYGEGYFSGEASSDYPDYLGQQDALRRSMRRHLRQMSAVRPLGGNLLEIGCSYGLFLDEARRHFSRVTGIDICRAPIEHARQQLGLDAQLDDFLTHDFAGQTFDAICLWDTIEHLGKPREVIQRCASLLGDRGQLFLTTGDIGSVNARLRGAAWRQIHPPSHVNYFDRRTIARLAESADLTVVHAESAAYFHTVYNVLESIRLRGRKSGRLADIALRTIGEPIARKVGFWINLGDIMFVAAAKKAEATTT
jgi:2-polyprenyl-3-methyl-5-hydroxy-6-metoxy-1,4-benzoquinol methylase